MTFGGGGGIWQHIGDLKQDAVNALVRQAHAAGINFIDTADVYSAGLSEELTGQAIRDLALTNVFPGDLLLKNFGVTRHGRVVFYDYDELCRVTDCSFRDLPTARNEEDEMSAEPWFYVGDKDVFPETFGSFLGIAGTQRTAFLQAHRELLEAAFWRQTQQRLEAGETIEVLPYSPGRASPGHRPLSGSRHIPDRGPPA